ncbi:MAG: FtsW/RodA/SpoVE family cell cycle protein [Anaerolineae bacterium]|nr:FtsW/RodA/SpoVE family cell cycle protein [Anaerolineae bacterium]
MTKRRRAADKGTATKTQNSTYDGLLLAVVVVLLIYGLLALFSATFYVGYGYWKRQLVWVAVSAVVGFVLYRIPYPMWQKLALGMMGINLVLLLITVVFARPVFGASRGLVDLSESSRDVGSLFGIGSSIQPGVLARLVAVVYIAAWLSSKGEQLNQVKYGLLPFGFIVGLVGGLVMLQPDLSTALLIVVTGIAMFFFAGGDPAQIFISILTGGATFGLLAWNMRHARERLELYLASLTDPTKMPYHVHRSVQAISEGGIIGKGLGYGRLKFGYLPFPWTDSIFAVIGEETGLIGCLLVLALFIFFAVRGYRIALSTPDPFGSLVAFGLTTMILSEALLNILVMIGLFPPTGTALPFFSYGGTEMLMTLAGVGLLLGISRGRPKGDWDAILDRWWRDGWARLPGAGRRSGFARHRS